MRAARQQDFLRQAKAQYGVDRFIKDPHQITKRLGKHMRTDASLQSKEELLSLVNLLGYTAGKPIRQVQFQADDTIIGGVSFVVSTPDQIAAVRHEFVSPAAEGANRILRARRTGTARATARRAPAQTGS